MAGRDAVVWRARERATRVLERRIFKRLERRRVCCCSRCRAEGAFLCRDVAVQIGGRGVRRESPWLEPLPGDLVDLRSRRLWLCERWLLNRRRRHEPVALARERIARRRSPTGVWEERACVEIDAGHVQRRDAGGQGVPLVAIERRQPETALGVRDATRDREQNRARTDFDVHIDVLCIERADAVGEAHGLARVRPPVLRVWRGRHRLSRDV